MVGFVVKCWSLPTDARDESRVEVARTMPSEKEEGVAKGEWVGMGVKILCNIWLRRNKSLNLRVIGREKTAVHINIIAFAIVLEVQKTIYFNNSLCNKYDAHDLRGHILFGVVGAWS